MNTTTQSIFRSLCASAFVLTGSTLLTACEPVVGAANASETQSRAPSVPTAAVYFGVEYAAVQAKLPVDAAPASPTF